MIAELNSKFFLNMGKLLSADHGGFSCDISKGKVFVVALSGGADSMTLAILANEWVGLNGGKLFTVTVDHSLRVESADEAKMVGNWMKNRGINHHILRWDHDGINIPCGRKQVYARQARYDLLLGFCKSVNAGYLLVAHTLDDQIETFLMRQESNSGDYGLASINAKTRLAIGVTILRPLLNIQKQALKGYLVALGQPWAEDPSNTDKRYKRVRIRASIAHEFDKTSIWKKILTFGERRRDLEQLAGDFITSSVIVNRFGYAVFPICAFNGLVLDVQKCAIRRLLWSLGGKQYPVSERQLDSIIKQTKRLTKGKKLNFGGCLIARKGDNLHIMRELRGINDKQAAAKGTWDRRFFVPSSNRLKITPAGLRRSKKLRDFYGIDPISMLPEGFASLPVIEKDSGVNFFNFNCTLDRDRSVDKAKSNIAIFLPAVDLREEFVCLN